MKSGDWIKRILHKITQIWYGQPIPPRDTISREEYHNQQRLGRKIPDLRRRV